VTSPADAPSSHPKLTLLFLHAHPDDESILSGASIAKATSLGHKVIVAYATRGDAGETKADLGGITLGERREQEAQAACLTLKVSEAIFLGYDDSGMADTETTANPSAFCNTDLDGFAMRLAAVLDGQKIDAVIGYDKNGTYGHPDHIKIHEAARRVAPSLGANWLLEVSYNRDYLASLEESPYGEDAIDENFATAADDLTHYVEGLEWFEAKMTALRNHVSQTPDDWDPDDKQQTLGFAQAFGTEWYTVTPLTEGTDLAVFDGWLEPKNTWSGAPPLPG